MSAPAPRPVTELPRSVPVGVARKTIASVQRFRVHFTFGVVLLLFGAVLAKVGHMQLFEANRYRALAAKQDRPVTVRPVRGAILDRHERPLAMSRPVRAIRADAGKNEKGRYVIEDVPLFAATVSELLDGTVSAMDLRRRIFERREGATGHAWVSIRANVDDPLWISRLDETSLDGLEVRVAESREYCNGPWAGPLLGRASRPSPDAALSGGDTGVECALNDVLSGRKAVKKIRILPGNRPFLSMLPDAPTDTAGRTVRLTIDLVIQGWCEQALDRLVLDWRPKGAVAIVLDPRTGDILALATRPSADPSDATTVFPLNYAVAETTEVGSTFKPFTLARALDLGVIRPDEAIPMGREREFRLGRSVRVIHDAHDAGEAPPESGTLVDALAHSSNPAFAEIAWRAGPEAMKRLLEDLDVGEAYPLFGVPEGREAKGSIGRGWGTDGFLHVNVGFGHGFAMTPLRLACSFAAFAREDLRPVRPRLVLSIGGEPVPEWPALPPIATSAVAKDVLRKGLRAVVTEGTAKKQFAGCPWPVAGKTGTAKMPSAVAANAYYSSSFVAYAPADAPRLVVLVMAIRPSLKADGARPYGGSVAAPAVRSILERTLGDYMGAYPPAEPEGGAR